MDGTIQAYVLDMAADTKKEPLRVKQYDTNSRQARITLKMGGEPWTIPFGCQIYINVRKTDGKLADATCTREDEHTVLAPITEQMTAVTGTQLGELYFLGSDGDIKTQTFPVVVYEAVMDQARIESSDDFQSLQEALRDVKVSTEAADIAAQYATEQGNSARDGAQRANDAADSIQVAVDAAANAKACESNAKDSETAAAQAQQEVTDYVEAQKAAFAGYSKRESDSKYANALTETATGEGSITVEDAWTAPVLGLDVVGKSEQVVTTGANLFGGLALAEKLKAEAEATVDRANRTVSFTAQKVGGKVLYTNFEAGKEYTIVLYGRNAESAHCNLRVIYSDGTSENMQFGAAASETYCIHHTPPGKDVVSFAGFYASANTLLYYEKCGIFEGNIALEDFETYTGGAPSPSPEYPQDIISTGTVSTGAQLLNADTIVQGMISTETGAESESSVFVRSDYIPVKPGDYILSGDGLKPYFNHVMYFNQEKVIQSSLAIKPTNGKFTVADETAYIRIRFISKDGTSGTVTPSEISALKPMLNAGDTALSWEPYTGGKPSPSVEYPQTLEVGVTGAQLFDASMIQAITKNGVTFTNNGDGSITVRGTATAQTSTNFVEVNLEPGQYRISGGNAEIKIIARVQDGETINYYSNNKFDVTISSNINIYMQIDSGKTVNSTVWPMLNAGDQPLPWEPYKGHQTANITLTEPLRGIVDYRDRIMCRDGVWGVDRKRISALCDGTNIKVKAQNTPWDDKYPDYVHTWFDFSATWLIGQKNFLSSHFKCTTESNENLANTELRCSTAENKPYIFIKKSVAGVNEGDDGNTKVQKVNAWIAKHPFYIEYDLAAPTWEPLPSATQQALNELTTYAGTTHLTITAGGPAAEVTLDYVQDTHKALEQCQEAAKEYTDNQLANIVAALPTATQAAIVDNQTTRLLQEV